jgi:hypothetical protein
LSLGPGSVHARRYRLDWLLGDGGTVSVWAAEQRRSRRKAALELLREPLSKRGVPTTCAPLVGATASLEPVRCEPDPGGLGWPEEQPCGFRVRSVQGYSIRAAEVACTVE